MTAGPGSETRALSRLFGAHAALASLWVLWRILENTPGTSSAWGGTFASSTAGRAAILVTIVGGVACLVAVVGLTIPRWRDPRASALLVALGAALAQRERVDVFDLVYVGLVALIAVAWFEGRRRLAAPAGSRSA